MYGSDGCDKVKNCYDMICEMAPDEKKQLAKMLREKATKPRGMGRPSVTIVLSS